MFLHGKRGFATLVRKRITGFASLCLILAAPVTVRAEGQAGASLLQLQLVAQSADKSTFELDFDPRVAGYEIAAGDQTKLRLSLSDTSRAQAAVAPQSLRGLVRSIQFEQHDQSLGVTFLSGAPAKVITEPHGDKQLLVTIRKLSGAEAYEDAVGVESPRGDSDVPRATLPTAGEPGPGEGYELVILKYADVSEVVGLLTEGITVKPNNVFVRREPGFGSPGSTATSYQTMPAPEPEEQPLGQSVDSGLAIDRRLNAIWIKGTRARIARMKQQIALIDVPVDSVILETQFVELTATGAHNIGVDFTNASGQVGVATVQAGQFVPFGFGAKTLDSALLQAALYAQIQSGEGKILSSPRIAAQSGSTAKIITGDALPILTSITLSGVNGVSQQVQYVNVGVTLQIAPRVTPDGFVTSHIYGVVSSVTGFSQGYPTISQREAETSATVRDGETFVIGGLTQENKLTSDSKIPLLGDIPLIGDVFSLAKSSDSKTELYIVIKPRIVRHHRKPSAR